MITVELDEMADISLMEVKLTTISLIIRLITRLRKKVKKRSSPKICLSPKNFLSPKMVRSEFFTLGARLPFTELRQTFVKALIFYHFDPKRHIQVETDISGYAIGGVLSQ